MRAIISDLHGNLEALQAVMAHIEEQGVTTIMCLGDVISYGPDPEKCIDIAQRFQLNLMGNHEEAVLYRPFGFNPVAQRAVLWTRGRLKSGFFSSATKKARWKFVTELPARHAEGQMTFVHGSPRNPTTEYIVPADTQGFLGEIPPKIREIFEMIDGPCFVGHSHIPGIVTADAEFLTPEEIDGEYQIGEDDKAIVNVGSVGQPRDDDPRACYVTYDGEVVRYWRVEYDIETTVAKVTKARGLDDYCGARLRRGE